MYKFKIEKIKFTNGEEFEPNKVNIIIGPNNSGKSKTLKEIADIFYNVKDTKYIVKDINYNLPESYEEFYSSYNLEDKIMEGGNYRTLRVYANYEDKEVYLNLQNDDFYQKNIKSSNVFLKDFGRIFLNYLGTENRLTMIKKSEYVSDRFGRVNFLTDLYNTIKYSVSTIQIELSKIVKKLFNREIVLDSSSVLGSLSFRVASDFEYVREGKFQDSQIIKKLGAERVLDKEGDGLKSFVSTYLSLKYNEKDIVLIDEPEAFLHPPLARQLGEIIGQSANENRQIFVTTHSSEMLKGILSVCSDVNVIRITRKEDTNEITILEKEKLLEIIRTPKLRVSKILEGLFCEKVVVTEAEADEIFYQEFLEKIQPQSGVFFTHVNSKSNIVPTSLIYSALKVNNAMVFDFDVIRNDNGEYKNKLKAIGVNNADIIRYTSISQSVDMYIESLVNPELEDEKKREEKGKYYHKHGINCLTENLKNDVEKMIEDLYKYNVFVLKDGELETNLQEFNVEYKNRKDIWISDAIEFLDSVNKETLENTKIGEFVGKLKK